MSVMTAGSGRSIEQVREAALPAARTLATVTLVGVGCGMVTVGVLSRLAMLLLARLNPEATGVTSDDGFVMGQFTLSGSFNLLLIAGPLLGVAGAGFYLALRGLRIGPAWFRLLSLSLGAGVVVGALIVHTTGVDFRLLEPLWLAVGLFVLLPAAYVVMLSVFAERALVRWPEPPWPVLVLGVLAWVPLLLGLVVLAGGWAAARSRRILRAATAPLTGWVARGLLTVVFCAAVVDLVRDYRALS